MTADSIHVYEALSRAQTFTKESRRIVIMAEDLLRRAGLAYLLEVPTIKVAQPTNSSAASKEIVSAYIRIQPNSSAASKEIVSAYIRIQQSYADLKDALYRLAKSHIEAKAWDDARAVMEALIKRLKA